MTGFAKCLEYDTVEGHIKAIVDFGIGVSYAIFGAGLERLATPEEEFVWRMAH